MLYEVDLTFELVDVTLKRDHWNESYTEQYLPLVLFIMPYKVVLSFEFVDRFLKSSESYWAVLSGDTVYYAVQGDSTRATQSQFLENACSEDDLGSRIFGTFVVNFLLACLSEDFRTSKKWYNCLFLTDFYPKKVT